jgi:hypothetical protein
MRPPYRGVADPHELKGRIGSERRHVSAARQRKSPVIDPHRRLSGIVHVAKVLHLRAIAAAGASPMSARRESVEFIDNTLRRRSNSPLSRNESVEAAGEAKVEPQ